MDQKKPDLSCNSAAKLSIQKCDRTKGGRCEEIGILGPECLNESLLKNNDLWAGMNLENAGFHTSLQRGGRLPC